MAFDETIDCEIDELGDTVTIREISKDNYNKWGDLNESSSPTDKITLAIPNILGNEDLEVKEGRFLNGDKRFFFNHVNKLCFQILFQQLKTPND